MSKTLLGSSVMEMPEPSPSPNPNPNPMVTPVSAVPFLSCDDVRYKWICSSGL